MPCYKPLQAWLLPNAITMPDGTVKVKNKVAFKKADRDYFDVSTGIDLPCGQCIGCRLERSRRWAVRIMHEAQMHEQNSFITLTYSDDKLPSDSSIHIDHVQRFLKRLRKRIGKFRYFSAGEYGCSDPQTCRQAGCNHTARPHYHLCIFGTDFSFDREVYKKTSRGDTLYTSSTLEREWGQGFAPIGDLTFDSAAYVARYCLKKITGDPAEAHYAGRTPEFVHMSRRPGIGATWYDRYKSDVYPLDECIMNGKYMLPPPFYDKLLEKTDPSLHARIKRTRERAAAEHSSSDDSSSRRLLDREKFQTLLTESALRRT